MTKACVFCEEVGVKITREHAWPSWVRQFLAPGRKNVSFMRHEQPAKQWATSPEDLGIAVNDICKTCNEGWMSVLENAVKPLMGPMLRGTRITLELAQQQILARWAHKTAMVFDVLTRSGGRPFYRDSDRRAVMEDRVSQLERTFVWSGRLLAPYEASTIDYRVFLLAPASAEAYCSTISLGECVLQVLTLRGLDDVKSLRPPFEASDWSDVTITIWPPSIPQCMWPPKHVMDAGRHSQFIDRWRQSERRNGST